MEKSFVIKGNLCQTKVAQELDLHEHAFAVCVDGVSKGVFDVLKEAGYDGPLCEELDKAPVSNEETAKNNYEFLLNNW